MDDFDFGWFIGIFEGEGTISTSGNGCHVRLAVGSTDEDVVQRVQQLVGGGIRGPEDRGRHKPIWRWSIGRKAEVEVLLEKMIPHLCQRRRERAEFALNRIRTFQRKPYTPRPLPPIKHGTRSGAQIERNRGLPVCNLCREADNAYQRERWAVNRRGDKRFRPRGPRAPKEAS